MMAPLSLNVRVIFGPTILQPTVPGARRGAFQPPPPRQKQARELHPRRKTHSTEGSRELRRPTEDA